MCVQKKFLTKFFVVSINIASLLEVVFRHFRVKPLKCVQFLKVWAPLLHSVLTGKGKDKWSIAVCQSLTARPGTTDDDDDDDGGGGDV